MKRRLLIISLSYSVFKELCFPCFPSRWRTSRVALIPFLRLSSAIGSGPHLPFRQRESLSPDALKSMPKESNRNLNGICPPIAPKAFSVFWFGLYLPGKPFQADSRTSG